MSRLWLTEGMADFKHVFPSLLTSDRLNLVAVDPVFCLHREEWNPVNQACGFLNLPDDAESWKMPEPLRQFLEQGTPPVYMSFGSLQQAVPEWAMDLFIDATRLADCRAIIQTSSENQPTDSQQDEIFFIGRHPHQPLFKHCAVVVHHGGAGTTQSATFGGCPSIVVPFMDEQLFWGYQLEKLKLAGRPLPARKTTAKSLSKRIQTVLDSKVLHENAQHISKQMQAHDGVTHAIGLINQLIEI